MAFHHERETSIIVQSDTRYSGITTNSPEYLSAITAVMVGVYFKSYAYFHLWNISASEMGAIDLMLGHPTSAMVDAYIRTYRTMELGLTAAASRDRDSMYAAWGRADLERLKLLQSIILESPFCNILSDSQCRASDGVTLTVHPRKISFQDCSTTVLIGDKCTALQSRTTASTIQMIAISMLAWNSINSVSARLTSSSAPRFVGTISSSDPGEPLISRRQEDSSPCCVLL